MLAHFINDSMTCSQQPHGRAVHIVPILQIKILRGTKETNRKNKAPPQEVAEKTASQSNMSENQGDRCIVLSWCFE